MPTTFSNIVPVRRVAVGDCSGPLGSGFDALARSAYTALLRAAWSQSADPPFLPVHDNGQTANKTIPRGDAWKCSYGYDDAARTERSACGAVCYTFALPSDATSGTPADISTVSLSLTGDRYLDAGVDLYLVPSESPTPPSVADLLALTPVGTYCATSDQSPTPPNERHGVTEAVAATPGVDAQPYLHVALLLHDYTSNRDAWIEGGAMLEGSAATIGFSREVAPGESYPSGYKATLYRAATGPNGDNSGIPCISTFFDRYYLGTNGSSSAPADDAHLGGAFELFVTGRLIQRFARIANNDSLDEFGNMDAGAYVYTGDIPAAYDYEFEVCGFALYSPFGKITGLTFPFNVNAWQAGEVAVALIESDSLPPYGSFETKDANDTTIENIVPWRAIYEIDWPYSQDGIWRGQNSPTPVIAATRRVLATTPSQTNTLNLVPCREPTKKWLWFVVVPAGKSKCDIRGYEYKWFWDSLTA